MKKIVWITFFVALVAVNLLAEAMNYFAGVQVAMFYRLTFVLSVTVVAAVFAGSTLLVKGMSGERPVSDRFSPREVLVCLNQRKTRATCGAVAGLLGIPPHGVGRILGAKRPAASWVVSSATHLPANYRHDEIHPDLLHNDRIIESAEELKQFIYEWRGRTGKAQPAGIN